MGTDLFSPPACCSRCTAGAGKSAGILRSTPYRKMNLYSTVQQNNLE
jgi:hypothetical protein